MRVPILLLSLLSVLIVGAYTAVERASERETPSVPPASEPEQNENAEAEPTPVPPVPFPAPLNRAAERVTKKPFGIRVSPADSPVSPERFSGFHTGVDFEAFPEEADVEVEIRAICEGTLVIKRRASGYGGVVAQSCEMEGRPVSVTYGHLDLASVRAETGESLKAGELIGVLGRGASEETDGERKHLHLGIHKGATPEIRGYVATKGELSAWIDPLTMID